jgi:glycosyltransferase involved in cell wall biosynthesis
MLKELRKLHEVTYLALDSGGGQGFSPEETAEYCQELVRVPFTETQKGSTAFFWELAENLLFSKLPYVLARYKSAAMEAELKRLIAEGKCDLLICDFLTPALNVPFPCPVPAVLFQHNVEAAIWLRMVENARNPLAKWYLRGQYKRMRAQEKALSERFGGVIAVSEDDAREFREGYGLRNVLGAVPTGVDLGFFHPEHPANGSAEAREARAGTVAFLGSMDWLPNIEAVAFYAAEVWPRVLEKAPGARFLVIGRNPPERMRELAARPELRGTMTLTGTVEDVRPHLAGCAGMVVPLTIGGGTRIKIYEAMAMGVPVVSTTIGAEGLPVRHEEHLLIADDAQGLAAATLRLLEDRRLGQDLAGRALALVTENFGWGAVTREFATMAENVVK